MTFSRKQELAVLFLFLVIFFFFVFHHIGLPPFWLDEVLVANLMPLCFGDIFSKVLTDVHPLFYTFLIKLWSLFFGDGETALRSFSALAAIFLLPLTYWSSRKWFGRRIALIALSLTASNYFLIWFANQNRPYALAALISLASYYFFLEIIDQPKKWKIALYIIISVCGFYTHLWFYFVFGAQILSLLLWRRNQKKIFIYQAVALLFALPSLAISFIQKNLGFNSWIGEVTFSDVLSSFQFFTSKQTLAYITISLFALFIYISAKEEAPKNTAADFKIKSIGLYFLVPIISAFVISQYSPIYVAGRYEIIVLPAFLILVSIWWSRINFPVLIVSFVILFGLTLGAVIDDKNIILAQKSNDKTMTQSIIAKTGENDMVIATDLSWASVYYYATKSKGAKNISLRSFPKEIESHPGWKNLKEMYLKKDSYQKEAADLTLNIQSDEKIKQVWVFYNSSNEINEFLVKALEQTFGPPQITTPPSPRQNSWFQFVYLFKK